MSGINDGVGIAAGQTKHDGTRRVAALRFEFWAALAMSGVAVVTFAFALMALPNAVPYPFTSDVIADQWPVDYLWMYPAMLVMLLFVAFAASVHEYAPPTRKIFSLIGLCFAIVAATVLLVDYFIQVTVLPLSLAKEQLDGWSMLTMYNPNGVFLALEELGYLLMSLSLAMLAPVFTGRNKVERTIGRLLMLSFLAVVGALVVVSAIRGVDRGDLFEIIVFVIVWLTLIVAGPLVAVVFRRAAARSPVAQHA